ncbi:MAG TPA: hotdog fold thioesterase [Chlamydiales bacterium]|nr:hotdog fold thioesterase [Chlamydiales bacterium]
MIWTTPITLEELNERAKNSLSDHLGIQFTKIDDHSLTATMPVDFRTLQPVGILHGGASAALAETIGSAAGNYCVDQEKFICVGLELNINHLRMIKSGIITAITTPLHLGKKTQVWEIKITDTNSKLIAISRLTLMVIPK